MFREFLVLRQRMPKCTVGAGQLEWKLANKQNEWINNLRCGRLHPDRKAVLDDIHPGILNKTIPFTYTKEPSDEWKQVFNVWEHETKADEV